MTTTRGFDAPVSAAPSRRARTSPLTSYDAVFLVVLNVAVVSWMWFRHGGLSRSGSGSEWLVSFGQLTGLYAGLAVLLGLVLVSRAPWLERR